MRVLDPISLIKMLSDRQCELVKLKVNESTDIPLLKESTEERIIEKVLEIVNPNLEPSLRSFCPDPYVDCLKIALQEGISSREKRKRISSILHEVMAKPLGEKVAGMIDVAMLPEYLEEKVLEGVCKKIVDEFVEWTVGEIDERFESRLQESREFAVSGAATSSAEADQDDS